MIDKQLKIGDKIWWSHIGIREVEEICPVCFGKLKVTVILGNGDHVTTPCDYCGKGYEGPKGKVVEHRWDAAPEEITVTGITSSANMHSGETKSSITDVYGLAKSSDYTERYFELEDLFYTRAEAQEACDQKAEKYEKEQEDNLLRKKDLSYKSYSWSVGYHKKEAKKAAEQLEYHTKKAEISKEKAKK